MNEKLKKVLALSSVFLFTSCSNTTGEEGESYAKLSDVEFWSTYSSEKVLQDNVEIYDGIKGAPALSVTAIRGEEEAAQIIMTSGEKAVKEYDVSVSDLTDTNGNTYDNENVTVYHERYTFVDTASEYYTTAGYFPDCLVPFEKVKEVGETGFKANNNQGLYVSFEIPEGQAAGVYTGTMTVTIGGENKNIPITLNVSGASIGVETHAKSAFLNEWHFFRGELDMTDDMYDTYNKFLFEYRLGCNNVTRNKRDLEYYAERVCEYAKIPECAGYNIPYFSRNCSGGGYYLNGRELTHSISYDPNVMQEWFRTIAYKGLEENVDPFKKAFIYGYDEPELDLGPEYARTAIVEWSYVVKQSKLNVIEELSLDKSIENQELLAEIIVSLEKLPHIVTSSVLFDVNLEEEDIVYAPYFSKLETETIRAAYRGEEDNDLWWYGCTSPKNPYPTYHIDDNALSSRVVSWMQADYNIQGNLYWATTYYSDPAINGQLVFQEDYYGGAADRCLNVSGEGYLLYPGAKYGVDGPLPSLRLEQIRDGLEEYEMIYKLSEIYGEVSDEIGTAFNDDAIMNYLYDTMYSGTKVSTTAANFEKQRSLLIDLLELACSSARVCVMDVSEVGGDYIFEVYSDSADLKQAGNAIANKTATGAGYVYTFTVSLSAGDELALSVETDGAVQSVAMNFGDSSESYDASYVYTNNVVSARQTSVATELVKADSVNAQAAADEYYVKLSLGAAEAAAQDILLTDANVIKKLGANDKKFTVTFYNATDEEIPVQLMLRYGSDLKRYASYDNNLVLKPGMNTFVLNNLDGFTWTKYLYIDCLRFVFGEKGDAARDGIYLVNMAVAR